MAIISEYFKEFDRIYAQFPSYLQTLTEAQIVRLRRIYRLSDASGWDEYEAAQLIELIDKELALRSEA